MALADWTDKLNAGAFSLTSGAYEGDKCLRINCRQNAPSVKTNNKSEADSPKNATIKTWIKLVDPTAIDDYSMAFYWRYQDTNNYFFTWVQCHTPGGVYPRASLVKKVGGSDTGGDWIYWGNIYGDWHEIEMRLCDIGSVTYLEYYVDGVFKGSSNVATALVTGGALGVGHKVKDTWAPEYIRLDLTRLYY